jgi:hypothetical protein
MKNIIKQLLKETLVNEFYGKSVIEPVTKRFNDSSDDMINKLAIAYLFKQSFGDIMQYKTKQQFDEVFNKWYDRVLGDLVKTTSFPDNRELAKKYLDAYINNIVLLGDKAQPFSMKKVEQGLVDLVNNNRWIKDEEVGIGPTIDKPNQEDVVYEDDKVIVLDTNTKAKCVMYGKGESWCITKPELNYYNTYRLSYGATPYFVLQKNVKGDEQKLVIMNYGGYNGYAIADRSNTGERSGSQSYAMPWYEIEEQLPNLQGLEKYFPYREITDDERKYVELLENIKANYSSENDYGFGDADDSLQKVIDKYSNNLVINGARVTSGDFIRDLAANRMDFNTNQLKSLRKETMNSLIEVGYFVNKYYDTALYEELLSPTQINRIIKLKIDSNKIVDEAFYKHMSEDMLKKYLMLRIDGNNNGTDNSYQAGINQSKLSLDEVRLIKQLLPDVKIKTNRYDFTSDFDLSIAIYADPSIITNPEVKENLDKLSKYQITILIDGNPDLAKYLVKSENFKEIPTWQLSNLLERRPKVYKVILDSLSSERKEELLDRLKFTTLLPLLIRDKYVTINSEEDYKTVRYTILYDTKSKAFVYDPQLLRFVNSSYDLEKVLTQQPLLFKYLGDKINNMADYDLKEIIVRNPKALKYIPDERIDKMGEYRIYSMIYGKPILARQLYHKIGINYVIDLIKSVPKVLQYLPDSVIKQLDKYDMVNILYKKELYPYMEPIIDKYIPDDKDFILDRI